MKYSTTTIEPVWNIQYYNCPIEMLPAIIPLSPIFPPPAGAAAPLSFSHGLFPKGLFCTAGTVLKYIIWEDLKMGPVKWFKLILLTNNNLFCDTDEHLLSVYFNYGVVFFRTLIKRVSLITRTFACFIIANRNNFSYLCKWKMEYSRTAFCTNERTFFYSLYRYRKYCVSLCKLFLIIIHWFNSILRILQNWG